MTSTEIAKKQAGKPTLAQLIERQKPEIARALPKHMNPDRMARIAITVVRQTPMLARCTPESFLGALMSAAQLGLEPGPLGEAYLVPFKDGKSGTYVATFIPGYKGLIKLAWQSGQVSDLFAEIVCENDEFDYQLGLDRTIRHKPATGDRGKPVYVYAAAKLKDGGTPFVVLSVAEVEAIRSHSRAAKNGPWVTHWEAMARKTAVRQLSKWLPMSSEFRTAVALDGSVRTDYTSDLVDVTPDYIDGEAVETTTETAGETTAAQAEAETATAQEHAVTGDQGEPGPAAPTPDAVEVVMATDEQLAELDALRDRLGHGRTAKGNAAWFGWVSTTVGREVTRLADLSKDEAEVLLIAGDEL